MRWDIGIDLGTENVRVAELRRGPVMDIPAAMAFREGKMSPICAGEIAQRLIGRTCEGVSVHYPLKDGVLENNFYAERLFHWLFSRSEGLKKRRHYGAIVTCQPFSRPVQREALQDAALDIPEQMGCALGLTAEEAATLGRLIGKALTNIEKEL